MRFRCNRHTCGTPPRGFEFEADVPQCPRCGASGGHTVHPLADVHFLVMGSGPMAGEFGPFHVACEPERPHLARHSMDEYAATDLPEAVTCPRCAGTRPFREMVKALFPSLHRELEMKQAGAV